MGRSVRFPGVGEWYLGAGRLPKRGVTGGRTFGALPGQTSTGDADAWIRKTDERGTAAWTVQFGTPKFDNVEDVDAAASGLFVIGATRGALQERMPGEWTGI